LARQALRSLKVSTAVHLDTPYYESSARFDAKRTAYARHVVASATQAGPSGDDAQVAKSGELPLKSLARVDTIRKACRNEAETGSLTLRLAGSPFKASPYGSLCTTLGWLHVEWAIYMVSSFHLTSQPRLGLAHPITLIGVGKPFASKGISQLPWPPSVAE